MFRLGHPQEGKKRAIIVKFRNEKTKWEVVKKGGELRQARNQNYRDIRIGVDMTRKEREENEKLKEELRRCREQGGRWTIRKNKVVQLEGNQAMASAY